MTQATLRDTLHFEGIGLHTGEQATVEVRPAPPGDGIAFVLGKTRVPAVAENIVDTSRATVLGCNGSNVSTTEHLLSALFAMGVTNAEIHVEGPEIPARDGSASEFVAAIAQTGLTDQGVPRTILEIDEPRWIRSGDRMIAAFPADAFRVRFVADFPAPIGTQYFAGPIDSSRYEAEIAGARTFAYLHEIEALWARGLGRGGSLENALIFAPDGPMQALRWPDEAVRHKVLDLIGDFALLGSWPQCEIVAIKSGHELHASMTRALRADASVPTA
ncbi:MAG TPA: UDP-3-O-acyl-N-acetylglucosamine deacetylase [Candidatus Cybelea sp.]|jgi:UDP-3-O-[3-hydroxymyristoyl] N-acetylglucosamine deacetylase|nr:UDP-3-O-acyl-N-acetylglucosamine deacetylase [Candidatus Cybelea sp.]